LWRSPPPGFPIGGLRLRQGEWKIAKLEVNGGFVAILWDVDCSVTEQRPPTYRSMALMPAGSSEPAGHTIEVDESGENPSVGYRHRIFSDSS
jgi:hypothetical protein